MEPARSPKDFAVDDTQENPFDDSVAGKLVGRTLAEVERVLILQTLNDFRWNRTRAATALGISVRCLRDKIHHFRDQGIMIPAPNRSRLD
jgi:DNA-binding NtrC family response regulator